MPEKKKTKKRTVNTKQYIHTCAHAQRQKVSMPTHSEQSLTL